MFAVSGLKYKLITFMVESCYIYGCSVYYIYGQILLHLWLVLHLWSIFITFMVGITFMVFITFMGNIAFLCWSTGVSRISPSKLVGPVLERSGLRSVPFSVRGWLISGERPHVFFLHGPAFCAI